jgi:hypothetical protein
VMNRAEARSDRVLRVLKDPIAARDGVVLREVHASQR